jgi:hypothetical protein
MRRKVEISAGRMDREYPHQIIIPCTFLSGSYMFARYFCEGLSVAPRTHSVVREDEWHTVFCFGVREDAEKFRQRFGGEVFDPKTRGRGPRWHLLKG